MTEVLLLEWNWPFFFVGMFGCFCKIFLEYYKKFQKNSEHKIFKKQTIFDLLCILIAGVFVNVLQVINPYQAFIFGAAWDFMFVSALNNQRGEENE